LTRILVCLSPCVSLLPALAPAALGSVGTFHAFHIPTPDSGPRIITPGPDGALWFSENDANKIGRVTTTGAFGEFSIPTLSSGARGITAGPDGNLWFTEYDADKIGRVTTSG